ncbi:MAG: hypothetical protein IJW65_01825 [Clostridia bacterium]|nr:hypothetical protein [Clostridia bacterium]
MKEKFLNTMSDWKDRAYETVFAGRVEAEKKATFWRVMFIVTVSILGVVVAGIVTYSILKKKFDNDIIARLKARFSREVDDLDFVEAASEDVVVDVVE